jgi:hypothetical protein
MVRNWNSQSSLTSWRGSAVATATAAALTAKVTAA